MEDAVFQQSQFSLDATLGTLAASSVAFVVQCGAREMYTMYVCMYVCTQRSMWGRLLRASGDGDHDNDDKHRIDFAHLLRTQALGWITLSPPHSDKPT